MPCRTSSHTLSNEQTIHCAHNNHQLTHIPTLIDNH